MKFNKIIITAVVILICLVLAVFGIFLFYSLDGQSKYPTYYKQGLEYYNKGDYQNAYYNFSQIKPFSDTYANAVYRQAKSADMLNDYDTAIKKYKLLNRLVKSNNINPYILWRLGNIYTETNKQKKAAKTFLELKNKYKDSEYGIASNYMLAKTESNSEKRREYLIEYVKYSPSGKYSKNVLDELLKESNHLDGMQKTIVANALYDNGQYLNAVTLLRNVPIQFSWISLIKSLDKLNSSKNVIKVGERGLALSNLYFDEKTLEEAVLIYIKHYGNELAATERIRQIANDDRIKGLALYYNINYSRGASISKKKMEFFENYPDSKVAPIVLYSIFRENLTSNRTDSALKYGQMHLARYNDKYTTPKILYFVAYLKKKMMDSTYKDEMHRLFRDFPNSYFAYKAYVSIAGNDFSDKTKSNITSKTRIEFPYKEEKSVGKFFGNFALFGDVTAYDDFRINDPLFRSWIEYEKGNRALSVVYARDYLSSKDNLPDRSHPAWKLAYPIYYEKEINEAAEHNRLNAYLLLALLKEESHFNPEIVSPVGAMGLLQVMPTTAEMIAGRKFDTYELLDPKINIELGAAYFASLMKIFSNNEALSVLSYNSGPNAVKKWLINNGGQSFDFFVENIPYNETKNYIKKVYSAYWNYILTYEKINL